MDIRDLSADPDMPYIYVVVTVVGAAFGVELCVRELVEIKRKPFAVRCMVNTWSAGLVGTHTGDPEFIVSTLSRLLDEFLNDYYKANPKKEVNHGSL